MAAALEVKCFKLQFAVILMVFCIKSFAADAELVEPFQTIDFEQMKRNIFTENISRKFEIVNATENDLKCVKELSAIGNGLINMELWAMKSNFL